MFDFIVIQDLQNINLILEHKYFEPFGIIARAE